MGLLVHRFRHQINRVKSRFLNILDVHGTRRINEVAAVTGRYENDRAEIEMLWKWDGKQYQRGVGSLPNPDRFTAIGAPLSQWWHL